MNGPTEVVSGAKRLRKMLSDPKRTVVAPGVYDGITARLALKEGFDCLYMVGSTALGRESETGTIANHSRPGQEQVCHA